LRTDGTRGCDPRTDCTRKIFDGIGMSPEQVYDNALGTDMAGPHAYNNIPPLRVFINKVSKVHDFMNSWRYAKDSGLFKGFNSTTTNDLFEIYSFGGMLPAAVFTGFAHLGGNPAILFHKSRDDKK